MLPSLSDDQIEDRYFLLGRMEILNVLNDLIHRRELVTVYFNGGRDALITTLLEARPDGLIFDLSGDRDANAKLPASRTCVFVSRLNGIRIQFACTQPQRFNWGGTAAYWVPLPERVIRLQRRESYRILMPIARPLTVKLYSENSAVFGEWPVNDLSVGGLGFNLLGEPPFELGESIARIFLTLGKQRAIGCGAVIRHATHVADKFDGPHYRVGMSFTDLPPETAVAIQRFIIKVELERRGLPAKTRR